MSQDMVQTSNETTRLVRKRRRFSPGVFLTVNRLFAATVPIAGVSYDMSSTTALGLELGLRRQGKPLAAQLFADPELRGVNDSGGRWSLPISAFAMVRF